MAWTYNTALTTDRDRLRLLVGDIDTTDQQLTDEALDFLLSTVTDGTTKLEATAAAACRALAAKYARRVDFAQGDFSTSASQRAERYSALAAEFQARVDAAVRTSGAGGYVPGRAGSLGRPMVGGVPVVNLASARANRVQPLSAEVEALALDPVTGAPLGGG